MSGAKRCCYEKDKALQTASLLLFEAFAHAHHQYQHTILENRGGERGSVESKSL